MNLQDNADTFINELPSVDLGCSLPSEIAFSGPENVFFEFYQNILGSERTDSVINSHGFERSALYGLHTEAIKSLAIPRTKLLELANGTKELIGFAFQYPSKCKSWEAPAKHYMAELFMGKAINEPLNATEE